MLQGIRVVSVMRSVSLVLDLTSFGWSTAVCLVVLDSSSDLASSSLRGPGGVVPGPSGMGIGIDATRMRMRMRMRERDENRLVCRLANRRLTGVALRRASRRLRLANPHVFACVLELAKSWPIRWAKWRRERRQPQV